jgi:hypothetical protein
MHLACCFEIIVAIFGPDRSRFETVYLGQLFEPALMVVKGLARETGGRAALVRDSDNLADELIPRLACSLDPAAGRNAPSQLLESPAG